MIDTIVSPSKTGKPDQYRLPEAHRQTLLAQSDSAQIYVEIERMRRAFIARYGNEFGVDDTTPA